jgi:hypothetical protein
MGMSDPNAVFEQGIFIPAVPPELEEKMIKIADEVKAGF